MTLVQELFTRTKPFQEYKTTLDIYRSVTSAPSLSLELEPGRTANPDP